MYKYELHTHTAEVSPCAASAAADTVALYKEHGYDGLVITDHYSPMTFMNHGIIKPQNSADYYLTGYRNALAAAGDEFTVLLGMEMRFYGNGNDYLVYGVTEDFIRNNGNLMIYYPRRFHNLTAKNNMIFVQAHPFRPYIFRTNPRFLDGCEVYNAKDSEKGTNEKALEWADKHNMKIRTGGADFHREAHIVNMSGIMTDTKIKTNNDLVEVLKNGDFEIIKKA
ncbi:MAG: hypothetical protein PUB20_04165 [Clostridia bacterium]|nr:hypothetical protein [Clostridia bacterium]